LFPLPLVLFPGETLKLHIFEERYKQLIGECLESGAEFGIAAYFDGRVAEYGAAARVAECFRTYDSGEMDIAVLGTRVFHLESFQRQTPGKLYPGGEAVWVANVPAADASEAAELVALQARLHELLGTGRGPLDPTLEHLSFRLGHESGLTLGQRVELLSFPEETERRRYLLEHLRRAVRLLEGAADTRARVQANGQFQLHPKIDL
jgi:Lon protease-like protein